MKIKQIILIIFLGIGVSSCLVSKSKYDSLYSAKLAGDRKIRNLLKEKEQLETSIENKDTTIASLSDKLNNLKKEFNNLKYDMSASNAQKSSEIDDLTKKLGNTLKDKETIKEKQEELENDLNWLRKERQRNTLQIDSLNVNIRDLENQLKQAQQNNTTTNSSLTSAQKKIEELTSEVNALKELLKREKETNTNLQNQLKATPNNTSKEELPEI